MAHEVVWNGVNDGRNGDLLAASHAVLNNVDVGGCPRTVSRGPQWPRVMSRYSAATREAETRAPRATAGFAPGEPSRPVPTASTRRRPRQSNARESLRLALSTVVFMTIPQLQRRTNVTSDFARRHLNRWRAAGVVERRPIDSRMTRFEYRLSPRGVYVATVRGFVEGELLGQGAVSR